MGIIFTFELSYIFSVNLISSYRVMAHFTSYHFRLIKTSHNFKYSYYIWIHPSVKRGSWVMGEGTGGISAFVKCSNMRSVQKKSSCYSYNEDGLRNIDVTRQPGRVDWNAHVRTTRTSLYQSVGGGRLLLNEHVLCVAITFKMSQLSFKSVSNFALSLNISPWELFG